MSFFKQFIALKKAFIGTQKPVSATEPIELERIPRSCREPVRVLFHLNEGYTKISLENTEGCGMADGGIAWDIPTRIIPTHLRTIGSSFILVHHSDRKDNDIQKMRETYWDGFSIQECDSSLLV